MYIHRLVELLINERLAILAPLKYVRMYASCKYNQNIPLNISGIEKQLQSKAPLHTVVEQIRFIRILFVGIVAILSLLGTDVLFVAYSTHLSFAQIAEIVCLHTL